MRDNIPHRGCNSRKNKNNVIAGRELFIRLPDAFGSINNQAGTLSGRSSDNVGYSGQVVGRDPDRNIRLQIRRNN
jgi:hypothetical protein